MEFECPECGRIYATAGTCPEDYLELTAISDDEEEVPKPFFPQDEIDPDEEDDFGDEKIEKDPTEEEEEEKFEEV